MKDNNGTQGFIALKKVIWQLFTKQESNFRKFWKRSTCAEDSSFLAFVEDEGSIAFGEQIIWHINNKRRITPTKITRIFEPVRTEKLLEFYHEEYKKLKIF